MHKECLSKMFFKKMHAIMENKTELALSPETFHKIKDLMIDTKKETIKAMADIEMILIDIKARLWDEKPDMADIEKLIDRKYSLKKESMKKLIEAFLTLKKSLSKEQMNQLHTIIKGQKEEERSCCR